MFYLYLSAKKLSLLKRQLLLLVFATQLHLFAGRSLLNLGFQQPHSNNSATTVAPTTSTTQAPVSNRDITIGPCTWAIDRKCPDNDVKFYLYTRRNPMDRQRLYIEDTLENSNLTESNFDAQHPTKLIIHGFNSDMFLNPLQMMRDEYLAKADYNVIYVDWSALSPGPCYFSAVHNTKHTGACVAKLVERILDSGSKDIHVIGFSLGAQLANYIARNLDTFKLPRITGLDPAMPLFITAGNNDKLDPSDANFVDILHTNALVQGKLEQCGHADFYMNGGIMQPGCTAVGTNPFACSHQRATAYFLESIRTPKGFWGWACSSYISYLLNMCPPTNYLLEAGENIRPTTRGMFLVTTNDTAPYALGKWTDLPTLGIKQPFTHKQSSITITQPLQRGDPLLRHIDQWAKLDSPFNNIENTAPTPDPYLGNWLYFNSAGTADITNDVKEDFSLEEDPSIEEQDYNNDDNRRAAFEQTTVSWHAYRHNLTAGYIDNSIFQLPHINAG